MAVQSIRARDFWHQLERQKSMDEPDYFQRGSTFRSSFNSSTAQTFSPTMHGPVWGSIYCTIRNRNRENQTRSSSASASNNLHSQRGILSSPRSTSASERSTPSPGRTKYTKMAENDVVLPQKNYSAPKRYETTCYFMPLAVPVWYSTSVSIKINSTKRNYKETVNYQKKLVPYRYVETMTTETSEEPPVLYVSEEIIERKLPAGEHFISLEPQQKTELELNKPFATNHHIVIENHI